MPEEDHIKEYLELRDEAKKRVDTKSLGLRQAWNAAEETTRGKDGLVDLESLAEQGARDVFKDEFCGVMDEQVFSYHKAEPTDNIFIRRGLWKLYAGINPGYFGNLVESAKEDMNYDSFMATIKDRFQEAMQEDLSVPPTVLTENDGLDVLKYLRKDPANRPAIKLVDEARLTDTNDMYKLMEEYLTKDIITTKFIEGKPYAILANAKPADAKPGK